MPRKKKSAARKTASSRKSATRKPARKKAAKRTASARKKTARKYSKKAARKVRKVMEEFKEGKLTSGRSGRKVKSRKQAIAIGLSEARAEGDRVPENPNEP